MLTPYLSAVPDAETLSHIFLFFIKRPAKHPEFFRRAASLFALPFFIFRTGIGVFDFFTFKMIAFAAGGYVMFPGAGQQPLRAGRLSVNVVFLVQVKDIMAKNVSMYHINNYNSIAVFLFREKKDMLVCVIVIHVNCFDKTVIKSIL